MEARRHSDLRDGAALKCRCQMAALFDDLPDMMQCVRTRSLLVARLNVRKLLVIGVVPGAYQRR
jgi:hypothetical protein